MDDDRPRWSITWLFRLQRTGRHQTPADDASAGKRRAGRLVLEVGLVVALVLLGAWLGLLPR